MTPKRKPGRPPGVYAREHMERRSVTMLPEQWAYVDKQGVSTSDGLRVIVERDKAHKPKRTVMTFRGRGEVGDSPDLGKVTYFEE